MRITSHPRTLAFAMTASMALSACAENAVTSTEPTALDSRNIAAPAAAGGVYLMTNGVSENSVLAFSRAANGSLTSLGGFPTGGTGTGGTVDPLISQYSVLLSESNDLLFVVNAGSDDVSAFHVNADASLKLASRTSSGGDMPVSLAQHGKLLYVLNAGDNTVSGLRITGGGKLVAIAKSTRSLASGAAGASTIAFTPDGKWIIVTERMANRIEVFPVRANGRLGEPVVTPSSGAVPFGFDITANGHPIITEAMGAAPNGAVSSYRLGSNGSLSVVTPSLDAQGGATCWLILTADSRYAFAANSASNTIASLSVARNATLTILNGQAANTGANTTPIDLDLTNGDEYLYTLEARSGRIAGFAVGSSATLSPIGTVEAGAGSSGLQGIAAF